MNCSDCQDQLIECLDGALPKEEAQAVQSHLAGCPLCQREEAALATVLREARAPLPEPGELFWINFLPRVRGRISSRPEPWYSFLWKPAVGWGGVSLAALMLLAGLLFWRLAPAWRAMLPGVSQGDNLGDETGYPLDEHLAQVVEASQDKAGAKQKVFEKLSPREGRGAQAQQGEDEDLDNLIQGLSPEQRKSLEEKLQKEIQELEPKAKTKEA